MKQKLRLTIDEPILPAEALGGFALRDHLGALDDLLMDLYLRNLQGARWYQLAHIYEARYDLGPVQVSVDVRNGKVFKLIASEGYRGKLFDKIHVGMNAGEAMALEPRLYYDEAEEGIYVKDCPGVVLEVPEDDPWPEEVPSYPISAIAVYVPEVWTAEGMRGRW